tara:strand:+ start:2907 stop:3335 length:429 start_codon:yes stop_codon:yes gene_type:complete
MATITRIIDEVVSLGHEIGVLSARLTRILVDRGLILNEFLSWLTPDEFTANQANFDIEDAGVIRASSDASRDVSGFARAKPSRRLLVVNVGSNNIVLKNQDSSSTAGNRIITGTGGSITLSADDTALLWYDDETSRWRIIAQ